MLAFQQWRIPPLFMYLNSGRNINQNVGYNQEHRIEAVAIKETSYATLIISPKNSSASGCRPSLETHCAPMLLTQSIKSL